MKRNEIRRYLPIIEAPLRNPLYTDVIWKSHCADGIMKDTDVTLIEIAAKSDPQMNNK